MGAVKEIKGGSGYWSQDSVVVVLALPGEAEEIEVRWPGGTMTTGQVPKGAREIQVRIDGAIEVKRGAGTAGPR